MVMRCMENSDFKEGVRAMLVDRDMKPAWRPSDLNDLTVSEINRYFAHLDLDEELDL